MKLAIALLALIGTLALCVYTTIASMNSYENKGKKALINNIDTCLIVYEERKSALSCRPKKTTVMYKDSQGKYHEQTFDCDLIKIIK